jgi:hypothetical protein
MGATLMNEDRLKQIAAQPTNASPDEVVAIASELLRVRPATAFVAETLKAIYINAKEEAVRSLVLDVITKAARTCLTRLKSV